MIKIMCGTMPTTPRCEGAAVLSPPGSKAEDQCLTAPAGPKGAVSVMLAPRDPRFQCQGDCGDWTCGGVKAGELYDVAGRFRKLPNRVGRVVYQIVPESLVLVENSGVAHPSASGCTVPRC